MSKYGSRKTTIRGITFDSKKEAEHYLYLLSREQQGDISNLICHPRFQLQPAFLYEHDNIQIKPIWYEADFQYFENGKTVVEDVKGYQNPLSRVKIKMFKYKYPTFVFRLVK